MFRRGRPRTVVVATGIIVFLDGWLKEYVEGFELAELGALAPMLWE